MTAAQYTQTRIDAITISARRRPVGSATFNFTRALISRRRDRHCARTRDDRDSNSPPVGWSMPDSMQGLLIEASAELSAPIRNLLLLAKLTSHSRCRQAGIVDYLLGP